MGNVQPPQGAEEAYAVAAAGQKILRNLDVAPQLHAPEATKKFARFFCLGDGCAPPLPGCSMFFRFWLIGVGRNSQAHFEKLWPGKGMIRLTHGNH